MQVEENVLRKKETVDNKAIKTAGSSFRYYQAPFDPQSGRRLIKTHGNKYKYEGTGVVGPDGSFIPEELFDPKDIGISPKSKKVPIMKEEDMMDVSSFPVQARTLRLPKNQKIVAELRAGVSETQAGIVNFVIGRETDMADAILKAAFPPGSGIVYKGIDGYNINPAGWGSKPDECGQKLKTLLHGNVKSVSREEFNYIKNLSQEFQDSTPEFAPKALSPISILTGGGAGRAGTGQPAQRGVGSQQSPSLVIEQQLDLIDGCKLGIEKCEEKMLKIDRYDLNAPQNSYNADSIIAAPSGEYGLLQEVVENYRQTIRNAQETIIASWKTSTSLHETPYDGTGFVDFEADMLIFKQVFMMATPKLVWEHLNKIHKLPDGAEGTLGPDGKAKIVPDSAIRLAYENFSQELKDTLTSYRLHAPKNIADICDVIISTLNNPYSVIITKARELLNLAKVFGTLVGKQDKIMILNNVVEGCGLVSASHSADGPSSLTFTQTPLLTDKFVSQQQRKARRAIVFVSRVPINFNIDGVVVVPSEKDAMLVDEEEGAALVKYFEDIYKNTVKKLAAQWTNSKSTNKGPIPVESMVSISWDEIKRLGTLVSGKTQTDALQFLARVFKNLVQPNGAVNGRELVKEATTLSNKQTINGASWISSSGDTKGLYRKEAKMSMDDYVYSSRTDWGTMVKRINDHIDSYQNLNNVQKKLSLKLKQGEDGTIDMSGVERSELLSRISGKEQEATAEIQGLDHFIVLYGTPGCGKSVYAQALANKLNFDLYDVEFGQTRGSLVGQSEHWFKAMLDSWNKMSNVVIRIDEIDGQVAGKEEEARASHNADQVKQLLTYFEDNKRVLVKNNIFIIATTNHPERIRAALGNRADEVMRVPDINDAKNYEIFLTKMCSYMKSYHPNGCIYDPDNYVRSKDLWPETEAFLDTIKPHYGEMAEALVDTGMNPRRLAGFVHSMLSQHMRYINSTKAVRLYNEDRNTFIEEYESNVNRDRNGNIVSLVEPKVVGILFTPENFIRACQLTYPVDSLLRRITIEERDADDQNSGNVHLGVNDLDRELYQSRYNAGGASQDSTNKNPVQPSLFDNPLMPPASAQTVASTDYYYERLVQAGVIPRVTDPSQGKVPIADAPKEETVRQWLMRVDRGNITEDDVVTSFGCVLIPIPGKQAHNDKKE